MKKIVCVLGLVLAQSAFALPNATERFNSLLPYGSYDGDDCRVSVSRTLRGNTKVTVNSYHRRIKMVIPKNQFYQYVPEVYYAVRTENKSGSNIESNYIYFSYTPRGASVLVGRSFYSPENSFDRNIECTLY